MERKMLLVSIILCLIVGSSALNVEPGACPKVLANKINLTTWSGTWIKLMSTINEYDPLQKEVILDWSSPKNGESTLIASSISKHGELLKIVSKLTLNKKDRGLYALSSVPILGQVKNRFWNVAFNPRKYSVSWACEELNGFHVKAITLYTRHRNASKEVIMEAQKESARNGIEFIDLIKYD